MNTPGCIAIIGANGHLGLKLLAALAGHSVKALVRSDRAAQAVAKHVAEHGLQQVSIHVVDYHNLEQMRQALHEAHYLVHLVGIIKESTANTFSAAHVDANQVLCQALAGSSVQRLCHLSILGADLDSANACLKSRGAAEQLLLNSGVASLILRIPMVLGSDDYASQALRRRAQSGLNFCFRGASLEQPIAGQDVIAALLNDINQAQQAPASDSQILELAGPESVTRAQLFQRAAASSGRTTRVISLPLSCGLALAWLLEQISSAPPVTRAMLGVLDHDDDIDPLPAATTLGITLTSLDQTLTLCLQQPA